MSAPTTLLCVFDTETTGVDLESDRIVTAFVGLVDVATGELAERREWLINPGVDISEEAAAVHGISNEVAQARGADAGTSVAEIVEALRQFTAHGSPVVAYNARFDLTLLDREARRHGFVPFAPAVVVDPYVIDKHMDRFRKGKRTLSVTAAHYGFELENAHDAAADAIAAGLIAGRFIAGLDEAGLRQLHANQIDWAAEQASSLQSYFRRSNPVAVVEGRWPVVPLPSADDDDLLLAEDELAWV